MQNQPLIQSPRGAIAIAVVTFFCSVAYGQAGLRESLERLDRNQNGEIDPNEVTALARPYLERISQRSRMAIGRRSYDIDEIQRAARRYYAELNGIDNDRVRPERHGTVRPFGPDDEDPVLPGFGLGEVKYPYTQDDLDQADRTLRNYDRDDNGYIDRREAMRSRWTHRDPFDDDLNGDDRLTQLELAQRYARRRLLDRTSDELRQKARRTWENDRDDERRDRDNDSWWWRRGGSDYWLTASLMRRFDENDNDRLERHEAMAIGLPVSQIDADSDNELTREELFAYLSKVQEQTGASAEGIPGWFYELDENRDRQVSMKEFASARPEKIDEFFPLDLNDDGLLTTSEMLRSKEMMGGQFSNVTAMVLPPGQTVISEIEVDEDIVIGDLNVQLSITHTHVSNLDAYLTGPEGQRIELFTEVGGHDDHFENTVFDDEARQPITKAKPPFEGSFVPEAVLKRQPGLNYFKGKSLKGVWQLVVRATRSDRFGMLHRWSLQVTPIDQMLEPETTASDEASEENE